MEGNPAQTKQSIVVWDPTGDYWEGALVAPQRAEVIRSQGGCVLPAAPELFRLSGVGGFTKRSWGSGWPLNFLHPQLACPLTVLLTEGYRGVHWAIRLVDDGSREPGQIQGTLRLSSDTSQSYALKASLTPIGSPILGANLGKPDEYGGWTLTGRATVHPPQMGHHGFALYGTMPGCRVAWAALSVVAAV